MSSPGEQGSPVASRCGHWGRAAGWSRAGPVQIPAAPAAAGYAALGGVGEKTT